MQNSGEHCFLNFLDCEEMDSLKSRECLAYGGVQVFSSGCILDLNLELCCCRKFYGASLTMNG